MNNYTTILRDHNLKATPQRLEITNALYLNGHISIDKLYQLMLKKFSSISLATIYKNVNLMIENSFIQEVKLPNEKSVYELSKASHSHMFCTECNSITDIEIDLSSILNETSTATNFIIKQSDLVLSGTCKNCQ